ncbi:type II secretion system protein [Halarchaeum grantii]|uniref:Type II secretion system protein n=1 Tax=Halarchaeum grantii TaxID=1193105 RepID=A0A830FCH9_9EURY|nr:type II/IV secretion system ATPase subunit [Halarchaeum grantii]GGL33317.1 type II secretion system protein [Halarchaeum grantii]
MSEPDAGEDETDDSSGRRRDALDAPTEGVPADAGPPPRHDAPTDGPRAELDAEPPASETKPERVKREVLDPVREFFEERADDAVPADATPEEAEAIRAEATPSEEFVAERWFDFAYLEEYDEVDRYWVNEPFAYVSVLYDADAKTYRYHVSEPVLDDFERYVREDLVRILRNSLMYQELDDDAADRETVFRRRAEELIEEHAATVEAGTVQKLLYYLLRDFLDYGRVDPIMRDGNVEDVSCDGADVPVYVYHRAYRDLRSNVRFDEKRLNSFVVRLAQRAGKHLSVSDPLVDASLPDGSRVQLTLGGDIATRGSNFTVRKFADVPYTPVDLVKWNTFSVEQMAYFWLAIENNRSLVFAGGTGSGKTTSLNAVSFFIPPDSKVVSIEDTREITLPHENWIQSVSRASVSSTGRGEVGTYQLLQASLRQRPEYILVGEIRTEQRVALTFFQAISTGHTAYTTVHADTVEGALARLQNPPLSVPTQMLQELDILSVQKQIYEGERRVRRNQSVTELRPPDDGADDVETHEVFRRDPKTDGHERVADSKVLQDIADSRGWDEETVVEELDAREDVLRYLVENDVTDYGAVAGVIHTYAKDARYVREGVRDGSLDPEALALDDGER